MAVESKKDMVSISNQAKDLQAVQKALKGVPDIRKDKVDTLLSAYEAGNYNVNGKDVADRIISSVIDKKA
jgi:negative regulator of flagellin synthesis FlgM